MSERTKTGLLDTRARAALVALVKLGQAPAPVGPLILRGLRAKLQAALDNALDRLEEAADAEQFSLSDLLREPGDATPGSLSAGRDEPGV
jgi:hypothetical protein